MSDVAEVKEALADFDAKAARYPQAVGAYQLRIVDAARRWVRMISEFPSDEQVEAAAEGLADVFAGDEPEAHGGLIFTKWADLYESERELWRGRARAALVAAVGVEKERHEPSSPRIQ